MGGPNFNSHTADFDDYTGHGMTLTYTCKS